MDGFVDNEKLFLFFFFFFPLPEKETKRSRPPNTSARPATFLELVTKLDKPLLYKF